MANDKNNRKNMNDDFDTFMRNFFSSFEGFFNDHFFNTPMVNFDMFNDPSIQQKLSEGPVYWGYSTMVGPDGKPVTKVWGNITPPKGFTLGGEKINQLVQENFEDTSEEPFIDIIEEGEQLRILAELPGITKENIVLKAKEDTLVLSAHGERHNYTKEVPLGFKIDPKSIKTQYNNGILEIKVKASKNIKDNDSGVNIKID